VLVTGIHVWTGVDRGLKPLRDLSSLIARRSVRQLDPIPDDGVPQEARSLTDTINDLLERLAAAMNAQRRFVENAAHQLRTPLAGLRLQAERALRAEDAGAMKPALVHIQSTADRLSRLSTQLLALARSESALPGGNKFAALDMTALVRECCMDWTPKALERRMELEFDTPETPVSIQGDATLLREAVDNLLDNAVRYGTAGGPIRVMLAAEPLPLLRVEDDGPGIPAEEGDKVTERFYRIQGTPGEGCGLGLAIVREIAERHGALLRIGPGPGAPEHGARIEIVFQPPPSA
jgi:two-component system sensor histidine kinase TctE